VIFRGGAQQRRPTDVDLLDRGSKITVGLRHGLFEWIKIDDDQIDRRDRVLA